MFCFCDCLLLKLYKMNAILLIFIIYAPTVLAQAFRRSSSKDYCIVPSPTDFSVFNLTKMQDDNMDSIVRLNENEYLRVHFCKPLKDPCNGKQDYAVCLHDDDKEIGVGKEPPKVTVETGKIIFRYTGDKCNEIHNYTVDIEIKCDFSIKPKIAADLDIVYNRDECGFQTAIETSAACAKRKRTVCELTDESDYYDLSPLMNAASNYEIKINKTLSVILNVCHSLIYGRHFERCNHETMICLVDESNIMKTKYTSLGNLNKDVRISAVGGSVYLDLTSDTPCHDQEDASKSKTIRTTIEFVCIEDATNKLPKYKSGLGTCHYKFKWLTRVACSEDILSELSMINNEPCTVTDPLYRVVFDLSILKTKAASVKSSNTDAEYKFSICSPLVESNCTKSGTGVCKYLNDKKIGLSKGLANSNLMWRRREIFLNYTDGMACGNNRRSFTTIIFKCRFDNTLSVDDQDPCATIITWSTHLVCNRKCSTPDNKFNLNRLNSHSRNYVIPGETDHIQYHLNICDTLVDEDYTNCTNGIGVCKVVTDDEGNRINEINLGCTDFNVEEEGDGRLYLKYRNGSVCEESSSKRITSEITFTCDVETHAVGHVFLGLGDAFFTRSTMAKYMSIMEGRPTFESYSNCKYNFNWKTGFVCPLTNEGLSEGCLVENRIEVFNFTYLIQNSLFKVNGDLNSGYFNVSVCGERKKCNGTFICDDSSYSGIVFKPQLNHPTQLVAFKFANETECKNDVHYNSFLKLWCKIWDGVAESVLLKEEECSVGLGWIDNNTFCKPKEHVTDEEEDDTVSPTYVSIAWSIIGGLVVLVLIFCCYRSRFRTLVQYWTRIYRNTYRSLPRESEQTEELNMQETSM